MKLVVIAGPARCGKTFWAMYLANLFNWDVISTDDFKDLEWDDVPGAIMEEIKTYEKHNQKAEYLILEGVRALSAVYHNQLKDRVAIIWWGEHDPKKKGCEGLLKRQQDLLDLMDLGVRKFPWVTLP